MGVKVHRRQWIITRTNLVRVPQAEFRALQLGPEVYLHYEASLPVRRRAFANAEAVILGLSVDEESQWQCGRFVTIEFPWLTLDATGAMGVYYFKRPADVICSSSISLIQEVSGIQARGRALRWGQGINWDPPPYARMSGLRRQYCDQRLNLLTGEVAGSAIEVDAFMGMPESTAADDLAAYLSQTVQQVAALGRPLFLGLTGGRDSRTVFAALNSMNIRFEAFTLARGSNAITDTIIAARLCRSCGVKHRLLTPSEKRNVSGLAELQRHTGGAEADAGREDVLGDYYRDLPDDAIVLHGGVFELGRRFYERKFAGVNFESSRDAAVGIADAFSEPSRSVLAPLRAWHCYRRRRPIRGMDYVDSFYLDQRRGGWGAANQQAQDSFGPDQIIVANSWKAIGLLISQPIRRRKSAALQMEATELLMPGITKSIPMNPISWRRAARNSLVEMVSRWPVGARGLRVLRRRLQKWTGRFRPGPTR